MYLICPVHTKEFLAENDLKIEIHPGVDDIEPGFEKFIPFVAGIHLPYRISTDEKMNLAALDDGLRLRSIEKLKKAIDLAEKYPVTDLVMHATGIKWDDGVRVGTYERMIEGIREVADYAAKTKRRICIENDALHVAHRTLYAVFADEWYKIAENVARDNVMLTLDTSHIATAAATFVGRENRFAYLYEYLKHPEKIARVHWSDSKLAKALAYYHDLHLVPGSGDLPREFHKKIKELDATKTLEQRRPPEEVLRGLEFIASL